MLFLRRWVSVTLSWTLKRAWRRGKLGWAAVKWWFWRPSWCCAHVGANKTIVTSKSRNVTSLLEQVAYHLFNLIKYESFLKSVWLSYFSLTRTQWNKTKAKMRSACWERAETTLKQSHTVVSMEVTSCISKTDFSDFFNVKCFTVGNNWTKTVVYMVLLQLQNLSIILSDH